MINTLDFVGVPSQDAERSRSFYVDTLGLRPDERSRFEFWAGETCFGIWEPERFGMEFAAQKNAHFALHVEDVAAARAELEARASSSPARRWTPASATWRSSPTPTGTISCCTTATPRTAEWG
jgi:catechol 2,3-dioxygenase-like lactoylglutathione lyase family enzyme